MLRWIRQQLLSPERTGDETDRQRDVELRLNAAGRHPVLLWKVVFLKQACLNELALDHTGKADVIPQISGPNSKLRWENRGELGWQVNRWPRMYMLERELKLHDINGII